MAVRQKLGEERVFYYDEAGELAVLPTTRTDVADPDSFVAIAAGRAYCRMASLLRLATFIGEGERGAWCGISGSECSANSSGV